MILAIDVHYKEDYAKSVGVLFQWNDAEPQQLITATRNDVAPYEPGQFYKRELPCIMQLLEQVDLSTLDAIIVDGHVFVDDQKSFGLGGYLYQALDEKIPVIGVAKSAFHKADAVCEQVYRGESKHPLWVSAIGYDRTQAATQVKGMHGSFRMPTILKALDTVTKEA